MIGFFEHQYLSFKKNHIRNLLALARADGSVHPKEEELLFRIGRRLGLKDRQVKQIVDSDEPHIINVPDNHDDRMNLVCDLLLMVQADDEVQPNEISFVEDAVQKLGMKREMVSWLLEVFRTKGAPPPRDEWEETKAEAKERFAEA